MRGLRSYLREHKSGEELSKLNEVAETSEEVLLEFQTVFPFDFFPDKVRIYRRSLFIDKMLFWGIHKDISIHYEDLLDSHLTTGLLFGNLLIKSRFITDQEYKLSWMWMEDARKLHSVLHGFMTAQKEKIDLKKIPSHELLVLLERIGRK